MLTLSAKDTARVKRLLQQRRSCVLCGSQAVVYSALFVPDKPELWGGTPGKTRVLGYCLCRACKALPDLTSHVEARIQAGLVGQRN